YASGPLVVGSTADGAHAAGGCRTSDDLANVLAGVRRQHAVARVDVRVVDPAHLDRPPATSLGGCDECRQTMDASGRSRGGRVRTIDRTARRKDAPLLPAKPTGASE